MGKVHLNSLDVIIRYFFELVKSPLVISGFSAILFSAFAWMLALSRLEISIAYPLAVGLNFLVVISVGIFLFGEILNISKIIGILLVFLSIYFLAK